MVNLGERKTAFIVLGVVLVLAVAFALKALVETRDSVGEDGCFDEASAGALYIILMDSSDKIATQQATILKGTIEKQINDAERGARVAIYRLKQNSDDPIEMIEEGCAPGKEENIWIESKRSWAERKERFQDAIVNALRENVMGDQLVQSPIIEAILAVDAKELRGKEYRKKNLIIASDMLQYTKDKDNLNHYQHLVPFDEFSETPQYRTRKSALTGVEVTILYLLRESNHNVQTNSHVVWWERFFNNSNGRLVRVEKIRGDLQ